MLPSPAPRRGRTAALLLATALSVSACGGGGTTGEAAAGGAAGEFTLWDPYPQFDETSEWTKLVEECGTQAGVTLERQGFDTSDLTNKALLAAQQGGAPNILVVDNPVVSTLADAGVLTTAEEFGGDTSAIAENLLAAGEVDGDAYGVPIGANTLALYYNEAVLDAAGVDPASVTDWASLTAALEKVKAAGKKGITFSAIGTEEGSFQFLPWFWGAGADLQELDSPEGLAALSLWKDWLDKGYAPNSVLNNTQTTSWQEFETGEYAFAENGTWQLGNVKESGIDWGVMPIPARDGGPAPAPTGGEFVSVPVQEDTSTYEAAGKIVDCLTSGENSLTTTTTLSYVAPTEEVQAKQVEADPDLEVWVEAVQAAKGRTSDNLGTKYPRISEPMWGAFQKALSGAADPAAALAEAQDAAAAATS
ncbi:multiple sugar transport system substrate-binding protein [Kineococcus xinjiangensis]|uniref:Multiple sugar transport system substrate-binding protein n=1 Tax=Kineococcus xinjiangensis TaxID=512762 RepID=A0A2S6IUJ3_9ACTN|nr:extracellular solute-binding protein [Kineococcus xinjiangensis]PPK97942.1 multiple sugar transport system substrate-binding protein [Kineococcus xinjiangensis]